MDALTDPPVETEVKLAAEEADLASVLQVLGSVATLEGAPKTKRLESRYFDTQDLKLRENRIALRVRQTPEGFVQTLKTEQDVSGGLLSRGEWETEVDSFSPDLSLSDAPVDLQALGDVGLLFVTDIERQKAVAAFPPGRPDASRIEVAIDRGQILAGGRTTPVTEVELELLSGHAADLFDLAARLSETVPVRFAVDTKSARGYRLATGSIPEAEKAKKIDFDPGVSLEEGMRSAFKACVRQWFANQTSAFDGRDIEGVHQMRVALRRLRSAFTFFKTVIPDPPLAEFSEESKWVANSLGPARDWDVFVTETLAPLYRENPRHRGLVALDDAARRKRIDGYETARIAMMSPRYTSFILRLCSWIERDGWREGVTDKALAALHAPMTDHAGPLLDKRYAAVRKLGDRFHKLSRDEKHQLRIAMKKLRYAGDFFRSLYPRGDIKGFRPAMTSLLEKLGKLNDLTVAEHLCGELLEAVGDTSGPIQIGVETLLRSMRQAGEDADAHLAEGWKKFAKSAPYWEVDAA